MKNPTMQAVREFIRAPYAFPGGYPLVLIMRDGDTVCSQCARGNYRSISNATRNNLRDGWAAAGVRVHWEGAPEVCANCGKETEAAYGEFA